MNLPARFRDTKFTSSPGTQIPIAVISNEGLAPRYEALIRLAQLIRSHPGEKDLFQTCASELHQVVPFNGINQLDSVANCVRGIFTSHIEDAYSREDQQFLSVDANQIAVAMADAHAQARLRLLFDVTNRIVTKEELRDLLREIVANITM
jgi:GAF domain-containing protein